MRNQQVTVWELSVPLQQPARGDVSKATRRAAPPYLQAKSVGTAGRIDCRSQYALTGQFAEATYSQVKRAVDGGTGGPEKTISKSEHMGVMPSPAMSFGQEPFLPMHADYITRGRQAQCWLPPSLLPPAAHLCLVLARLCRV
jgi:hypothetical protein